MKKALLFTIFFTAYNILYGQSTIFYVESFETDGKDLRYTVSHDFQSGDSYFTRGRVNDFPDLDFKNTISSINGNYFYAAEYTTGFIGAPGIVTLTSKSINISNYTNLRLDLSIAALNSSNYDPYKFGSRDYFDFDYSIDEGPWTRLKNFRAGGGSSPTLFYTDNNLNNVGGQAGDTQITPAFKKFASDIAGTGSSIRFRVIARFSSASEVIAFDFIRIKGTQVVEESPLETRMLHQYCGIHIDNTNTFLWGAQVENASNYQFEISGPSLPTPEIITETRNRFLVGDIPGIAYNNSYNYRIRAIVNGVAGPWSDLCTFVLSEITLTNIAGSFCNTAVNNVDIKIPIREVGLATDYRFQITGPNGFNTVYTKGGNTPSFTLAEAGATLGGIYTISVASFVEGNWTPYGTSCTINVNGAVPSTKLIDRQCNITIDNLAVSLWVDPVQDASSYRWEVTGNLLPLTVITTSGAYLQMSDIPGVTYGDVYTIRVSAEIDGLYGDYGQTCTVTASSGFSTTQLVSRDCGRTVTSTSETFYAEEVGMAESYDFEITYGSLDTVINKISPSLNFKQAGISIDSTYNIRVRPILNGLPANYGSSCSVTLCQSCIQPLMSSSSLSYEENILEETNIISIEIPENNEDGLNFAYVFKVYPNPTSNGFNVELPEPSGYNNSLLIYDLQGKTLFHIENISERKLYVGELLPSGIYILEIINGDARERHKIIKN